MEETTPNPQEATGQQVAPQTAGPEVPLTPSAAPAETPPVQPQPTETPTPMTEEQPPVVPPQAPGKGRKSILFLALGLLLLALLAAGGYFFVNKGFLTKEKACTQEAKVCPDGTSVGRTGPNCEFAACPTPTETPDPTASWKTYTNENIGFLLKYPSDWSLKPYDISTNYPLHGLVQLTSNINSESLNERIILSYWDNQNRLSLEEIENKYKGEAGGPDIYFPNGKMIDFLGKQAYKGENVSCAPMMCDRIAIIKDTKVIEIKSLYGGVNRNKAIFDQILSTFKFIEATPSAIPTSSPSASPTP